MADSSGCSRYSRRRAILRWRCSTLWRRLEPGQAIDVRHGTTVGTNTMLERKGARVAFVTTAGFEDTIAIGRQTRSRLYDWFAPVPECLVPRELRFGVPERVSAEGEILRSPTDEELDDRWSSRCARAARKRSPSLCSSRLRGRRQRCAWKRRCVVSACRFRARIAFCLSFANMSGPRRRSSTPILRLGCRSYLTHLEQRVSEPARHPGRARGRDAVLGRDHPGAACGPRAGAHSLVRTGGRRDRRVPSGALGRLRAHHWIRHGRHLDRCLPRRLDNGRCAPHA